MQGQPLFQQAWELAQTEQQDFYAIDAAHMLAIIAPAEQQLEWNLRALTLAEQSLGGAGRCRRRMFVLGRKLVKGESLAPNPCVWDNRPIGTPSSVH